MSRLACAGVVVAWACACSSSSAGPPALDAGGADATGAAAEAGVDGAAADARVVANGACLVERGALPAATLQSDPGPWLERATLERAAGLLVERVRYRSGGLVIVGMVCRPDDAVPHPVLVVNHGGFAGIGADWTSAEALCRAAARNGLVVMQSSYRGEDGSEGQVEICAGEVDDVAAMLAIVRAQPYALGDHVVAFGGSHGGCISARLALRDPSLRAVAEWFGPSDFPLIYRSWEGQIAGGEPSPSCAGVQPACQDLHACLLTLAENSLGGTPAAAPASYRARSWVEDVAALKVPALIMHGTVDSVVPLEQSCEVRAALTAAGRSLQAWYLDPALAVQTSTTICGGDYRADALPSGSAPGTWSAANVYLFVLEGQGHGFTGPAATLAGTLTLSFLASHL